MLKTRHSPAREKRSSARKSEGSQFCSRVSENENAILNIDNVVSRGGGGGTPILNRRGCSSEILNLTPKGDHLGVAQAFCDP